MAGSYLAGEIVGALARVSADAAAQIIGVGPSRISQLSAQLGGRFEPDGLKTYDRQLVIAYAAIRRERARKAAR